MRACLAVESGQRLGHRGAGMSASAATAGAPAAPCRSHARAFWLIAPALVLIGVFLVLPYLNIVVMSLRAPAVGAPYGAGLHARQLRPRCSATATCSACWATRCCWASLTTPICLAARLSGGLPPRAHALALESVLYVLVLSPLLVGVVVRSFGWLILLSGNGVSTACCSTSGWSRPACS